MSRNISVNQYSFAQVPNVSIPRSRFDRSFVYKTTFNEGSLVPFYVEEVLPGDSFNVHATCFCRMATPIAPIMDNLYFETFFFFIPNRLLWDNWQRFCGEQDDPGDSTDFIVPEKTAPSGGYSVGSLLDYFGLPTGVAGYKHMLLPLRAYWLVWNEWFRDENLQDSAKIYKGDSSQVWQDESNTINGFHWYDLAPRGKRHDYFTSALPWPQKGEAVNLPLGESAPVYGLFSSTSNNNVLVGNSLGSLSNLSFDSATSRVYATMSSASGGQQLYADLSDATAATINSLRQAFQLQRFFEKSARSGSRYIEILKGHFGVTSPDARLQRPEYLGGSHQRISINPVVQNSSTDSVSPQGNLAAFGVCGDSFHGFNKSFVEHGIIIGLCNVRADLTYQQGLNRMWSRRTMLDYMWPSFAHLGEQTILNKEIYCQGNSQDDEPFGYQERYAEYRYHPSLITGKFRSTYSQSLDVWHLSQKFDSLPTLSNEFIQDHPPIDRIVAVPSEPHFLLDVGFKNIAVRPLPLFGVPGLIDHF